MNLGFWQGPFPVLATCPLILRGDRTWSLGGGGGREIALLEGAPG